MQIPRAKALAIDPQLTCPQLNALPMTIDQALPAIAQAAISLQCIAFELCAG